MARNQAQVNGFVRRLDAVPDRMQREMQTAAGRAGARAKRGVESARNRNYPGARMRNLAKNGGGVPMRVRYDVKGKRTPSVLVKGVPPAPWYLAEHGSYKRKHWPITPVRLSRRTLARLARQGQAAPGRGERGARRALRTPWGPKASVYMRRGVKGKGTWSRGVEAAERNVRAGVIRDVAIGVRQSMRGRS